MTGPPQDAPIDNPWERYGWTLAAIWLVFLAFPVIAVVEQTAGRPLLRGLHLGLLVLFAVIYLWAFMRGQQAQRCRVWSGRDRAIVYGGFAGLAVIVVVVGSLIGPQVFGATAYMGALAAWSFRTQRAAVAGVVGSLVFAAVIIAAVDDLGELWGLLAIPVLVSAFSLMMRVLTDGDYARELLQRDLAVSTERDRVARDVHDVLGHSLTVISLKADLAERLIDIDPDRARDEVRQIQSLTRQSLAEIRATVAGLRVARLAEERESAATALRDAGIAATLPADPDVVDPGARITAAWVLRESVTNVVRHSGAQRVEVDWGPTWLEIADDGRGLRGRREGSGLTGLRERVAAVGGRIEIGDGLPGGSGPGTRVRVELGPTPLESTHGPAAADGPATTHGPGATDDPAATPATRGTAPEETS
ncbi:sensor histidine kinase [Janibacter indicus]|uniref:Sensor histidine kinase n=1 Tax=Janibacter indicus TaxID=857417 RepID=A0A7L9J5B7_9MICO|nr:MULTISPECIES: histidine kinase [Janibacter]MCW4602890.1 histidine kinase [Janibacter hoylei]QOK23930.1 sensor histidine kinase [Janibacter indicus]